MLVFFNKGRGKGLFGWKNLDSVGGSNLWKSFKRNKISSPPTHLKGEMTLENHDFTIGDTSSKPGLFFSSQSFVRFAGGVSSSCSHARATGWRKGLLHRVLILQLLQDLQRKRSSKLSGVQVPLHHRKEDERRVHLRIDPRKKKRKIHLNQTKSFSGFDSWKSSGLDFWGSSRNDVGNSLRVHWFD